MGVLTQKEQEFLGSRESTGTPLLPGPPGAATAGNTGSAPQPYNPNQNAVPTQEVAIPFSTSSFTADTVAQQILIMRPNRKYLLIQNNGVNPIYINFDSAPTAAIGVKIPAGGNYEPSKVPTNSVFVIASGSTPVTVIEGF